VAGSVELVIYYQDRILSATVVNPKPGSSAHRCLACRTGYSFLLHLSFFRSKLSGLLQMSNPQSRHRARLDEESRRFRANISVPPPTSWAFIRIRGRKNAYFVGSLRIHIRGCI
jgi:hypothetical protein